MGSRRRFTKEFKHSVVQQLDSHSAAEVCREHDIHQNMLHCWKKEYESNPYGAFSGNGKLWKEEFATTKLKFDINEKNLGNLRAKQISS